MPEQRGRKVGQPEGQRRVEDGPPGRVPAQEHPQQHAAEDHFLEHGVGESEEQERLRRQDPAEIEEASQEIAAVTG